MFQVQRYLLLCVAYKVNISSQVTQMKASVWRSRTECSLFRGINHLWDGGADSEREEAGSRDTKDDAFSSELLVIQLSFGDSSSAVVLLNMHIIAIVIVHMLSVCYNCQSLYISWLLRY